MDANLFTQQDPAVGESAKSDFYGKMLEQRQRPEIMQPESTGTPVTPEAVAVPQPATRSMNLTITEEKITPKLTAYNHEEVLEAATVYFEGDKLAASVWMNKYALKDSDGNIYERTPDDMHRRLAREVARMEKKYPNPMTEEQIFQLFRHFRYIVPQGSPMAGIGNDFQISSLSNCFVIGSDGNQDSYGGIMKVDQEQVQLMKRRGGVGHDLSHIRPAGSPVKNSALTSTGIVPFMERFSNSTREVAQDGRRGALMLSISIKHPDSENFIDAKMEQGKVTGANVSVKIDDDFMRAVKSGSPYRQQYPIDSSNPMKVKEIGARDLWNKIIHNAWQSAEPGILFWDTIIRESVPDCYADLGFKTLSTNPCGEIPLCAYDSCRLIAMNLFGYVDQPFTPAARFNTELFREHSNYALRIMDDIIDLEMEKIEGILAKINADPEDAETKRTERILWEKIREKTLQGRRTGIGITAEGDMLAALGLRYGTDEATSFSVDVHKTLAIGVYGASADLAAERGAFPVFDIERERNNPLINRIREAAPEVYAKMEKYGRRNISMLTIAPTGSVSICTQTASGIEPVFMVSYKRRRKVNPNDRNVTVTFVDEVGDSWEEYNVFHPKFLDWMKASGYDVENASIMTDEALQAIIAKSPYYKATSNDIDWVAKVKMQGAIQKWVDHSISVTVNLPADVTEDLVSQVYLTAWESGCKGMTIYRDGSRSGVLVSNDTRKEEEADDFRETKAPARPKELGVEVVRFMNEDEKWIAFVGLLNSKPYEIFTGKSTDFYIPDYVKNGWVIRYKEDENTPARYDFEYEDSYGYRVTHRGLSRSFKKEYWNYAKLISGILRHGMPLPYVVELIDHLSFDNDSITTWKNGVLRGLKKFIPDGTQTGHSCPQCKDKNTIVYKEGCMTCTSCGYSKCG
jgi:ribonucleoside-diphosphate reductase alpha chain